MTGIPALVVYRFHPVSARRLGSAVGWFLLSPAIFVALYIAFGVVVRIYWIFWPPPHLR